MLAEFTVTVHEARKPLAVHIKIHESTAALRGAAKRYSKLGDPHSQDDFSEVLGICHRFHMADCPIVALVRLAPPHLGAGLVAHEMAHAAVWMWEIHNKFDRKFALDNSNDEWFCWVLGELVRQTTIRLYEDGVYDATDVVDRSLSMDPTHAPAGPAPQRGSSGVESRVPLLR